MPPISRYADMSKAVNQLTRLFPPPLHRVGLRAAHALRHRWRLLVKARLAGVSVIGHREGGSILLVRHSYGPPVWALPGGGMSAREHPLAAAEREIREELGCGLEMPQLVARLEEEISGSVHVGHIVAARLSGPPRPDRREVMEARFFPLAEFSPDTSELARRRIGIWLKHRR